MTTPRTRRTAVAALTSLATAGALFAAPPAAQAAESLTDQASVTTGGFKPWGGGYGGNNDGVENRQVSADGRYVVMVSSAPLVKRQTQLDWQVHVRDRKRGTTTLVSVGHDGGFADGRSWNAQISADGRRVAWESEATNLVPGDTNDERDVFVRDLVTGTTTRVSVASDGAQAEGDHGSWIPSLSADGMHVVFASDAPNLAPGLTGNTERAFLHDLGDGTTELVSLGADDIPASVADGKAVSVSGDGSKVSFVSLDAEVTQDADNQDLDVFVRDRVAGTTVRVAGNEDGADHGTLSADGRFLAYESPDPDIVPGDTNGEKDVFVVDLQTESHTLVSRSSSGALGDGYSQHPQISADGRFVVFESNATNLVAGDTNGYRDVFRHDLATGATERMNLRPGGGQSDTMATVPGISGDGGHVTFYSTDGDLTSLGSGWGQTYVRDLDGRWPAMRAVVKRFPKAVKKKGKVTVRTVDIAANERVRVVWKPKGKTKGKTVTRWATVKRNRFTVRTGPKPGKYLVKVHYAERVLRKQTVRHR